MNRYVVTGASSEIGLAVVRKLLFNNVKVVAVCATRPHRIQREFSDSISDGLLQICTTDFNNPNEFISDLERSEPIDGFVGLAALRKNVPYGQVTFQDLEEHFRVNVIPNVLAAQLLGPRMAARGFGRFVIAGSIGVKFGGGKSTYAYALSKLAQELIPAEAKSWSRRNVLYNVVRIGFTATESNTYSEDFYQRQDLIPIGRAAEPEEIAKFIHWLASGDNTYVSGQVLAISGGE